MKRAISLIIPLLLFAALWQVSADASPRVRFLFASPISVWRVLVTEIASGAMIRHFWVTGVEAFIGLVMGVGMGSIIGFTLLYFPDPSRVSRLYILALSAIPIFAIAPMMIIWFGTGMGMKVAMAFFSTIFVSISQALEGGNNVTLAEKEYFRLQLSSRAQTFKKLTLPASMSWVIQSLRINSGLAILGAFIGEFISSEEGLGYLVLRASGVYDVPLVLASVVGMILLSFVFALLVWFVNKYKLPLVRLIGLN